MSNVKFRLVLIFLMSMGVTLVIGLATPLGPKLHAYFVKSPTPTVAKLNIPSTDGSGQVTTNDGQTIAYGDAPAPTVTPKKNNHQENNYQQLLRKQQQRQQQFRKQFRRQQQWKQQQR